MKNKQLKKLYEFYLEQQKQERTTEVQIKNFKFLELALLRECINQLLKDSEA